MDWADIYLGRLLEKETELPLMKEARESCPCAEK